MSSFSSPRAFTISLRSIKGDHFLSASEGRLTLASHSGEFEKWQLNDLPGENVSLKNYLGDFLSHSGDGLHFVAGEVGVNESLSLMKNGEFYTISFKNEVFLRASENGQIELSPFPSPDGWDQFIIEYHFSPSSTVAIRSHAHGDKLLTTREDGNTHFDHVEEVIHDSQKWYIQDRGNGIVSLQNIGNNKYLCLDGGQRFVANREAVGPWEEFQIETKENNVVAIKSAHFHKYLCHAPHGGPEVRDHDEAWEHFTFEFSPVPSSHYTPPALVSRSGIAFRNAHGRPLTAEPNGSLPWRADAVNDWEKWSIEDVGNGKSGIKSHHGKYLCLEPSHFICNRDGPGGWEQFTVIMGLGNKCRIFSDAHGPKYLCATSDGKTEIRDNAGAWELFTVEYH